MDDDGGALEVFLLVFGAGADADVDAGAAAIFNRCLRRGILTDGVGLEQRPKANIDCGRKNAAVQKGET